MINIGSRDCPYTLNFHDAPKWKDYKNVTSPLRYLCQGKLKKKLNFASNKQRFM
jgi:hypothetical protein